MRARTWLKTVRPLAASPWVLHSEMVYLQPVHWILDGITWEGRSGPGMYLWRLQMPLYVPADGILDLSYSQRHGGGTRVWAGDDADTREAIAQAMELVSLEARARRGITLGPEGADNIRFGESWAYALFLHGDTPGALDYLSRVGRVQSEREWVQQLVARVNRMRRFIEGDEQANVLSQLQAWRSEALGALKIDPGTTEQPGFIDLQR